MKKFDPKKNYEDTLKSVGYIPRKNSTLKTYEELGFKGGLEVHQQLLTKEKLFCRCPSGIYQEHGDFDAEIIRHMRPTLSELGEYDGTALMEFKTKKEIIYRIKDVNTCTYEIDDTPPFRINREALEIAILISLLCKLNIVGEVHITRKQYLDGSIPTGFQRTAIIGVEGEIPLKNKKIRLIQLSLEEDSCREITDIGHLRVFKTDRLGMPLIETVTYPDCTNPEELREACDYIRFLNRSTGLVRTGMGAARQDVNVSCRGGTRVEIKGVAHTKWIPELTHNECFRQFALLKIRDILKQRISSLNQWKIKQEILDFHSFSFTYEPILKAKDRKEKIIAVNLPKFKGILSHFTQPGKTFADELADRLKVIACLEKPNMVHTEEFDENISGEDWAKIRDLFHAKEDDAQLIFWAGNGDLKTAIETLEERCQLAYEGVPRETRKSMEDGTTIFERVLPGADRMYPDTDSSPIPLEDSYIEEIAKKLPEDTIFRFNKLRQWNVPEDTFTYILKKNLFPVIDKIINDLGMNPKFVCTFFGHNVKYIEGHYRRSKDFTYEHIYRLFAYVTKNKIELEILKLMLPVIYEHPNMDFDSVLTIIKWQKVERDEIISRLNFLKEKFRNVRISEDSRAERNWIMGELHNIAIGNISLRELSNLITEQGNGNG